MLPRHRTKVVGSEEFKGYMKQDLRMPHYEPPRVEKPDKVDHLYPMKWPVYNNSDVEHRVDQVVGSVSLFAPYPHEEDSDDEPQILLERPVTPISEEIKLPPNSFNQLVKYVRRRISAKRDTPHLSVEDQQNLAGVLMGEVNGIWREVKKQVDDPFLTSEENRELNRRISVYIVTVCERLFKHYLKKAQVLNSRGVFSGPANMCRLKAQLALDASRLLNILTVRRYIVSDMRGHAEADDEVESLDMGSLTTLANPLSFKSLMQSIRPKSGIVRPRQKTAMEELQEITDMMPELDTGKLVTLLEYLPCRTDKASSGEAHSTFPSRLSRHESNVTVELEEKSRRLVLEKRSRSLPTLKGQIDSLQEELGLEDQPLKPDPTYEINELLTGTKHEEIDQSVIKPVPEEEKAIGAADLQQLIARSKEIDEDKFDRDGVDDMPSLLQALTRGRKHDGLKKKLEEQLQQLEEKQHLDEQKNIVTIQEPKHPQPATVSSKLTNKMVVRTSDIRVSERVCMSSLTLHRFATVYNDLQDEVDASMVKHLDKNLFLKDEIKEVYKEIMKSASTDHLHMDNDELVMPAADNVDLSTVMSSSTLNKKKAKRVINPQLERPLDAPWGEREVKDWVKTPNSPPKNFRGESQFPPFTPNLEKISEIMNAKSTGFKNLENMPPAVAEKMARTYASWLQWWKSNVSTDDYMKYLSTQDTDFLAVLYHFYDSEDVGIEEEEPPPPIAYFSHLFGGSQTIKPPSSGNKPPSRGTPRGGQGQLTTDLMKEEKDEKKLAELRAQKMEFKEGFWNVNSVMMGGLGREPTLEVVEAPTMPATPESEEGLKAAKTLMGRALARRSARSSQSQRDEDDRRSSTVISRNTITALSVAETSKSSTKVGAEDVKQLSPQERLENVWTALHMPDSLKLDMAIKYSCDEFYDKLIPAIEKWELLTDLIIKREAILSKLEKFERFASDPNRFFVRGHKGSSAARLDEARHRSAYYRRIEELDEDIKTELDYVKNNLNDNITYKGRLYTDKMKWDRIEMLYWLQEERKQNAIRYESIVRQIPIKPAQLQPIRSSSS